VTDWESFKVEPRQGARPDKKLAAGSPRSMCVRCWEVFSTERNFDRHLKGSAAERFCVQPNAVGLVQRANGDWIEGGRDQPTHWER
jgi:hypothetical protein